MIYQEKPGKFTHLFLALLKDFGKPPCVYIYIDIDIDMG